MAEPRSSADDTVAAASGETVGVPNRTSTDAVELAWSGDRDIQDIQDIQRGSADDRTEPADVRQSWLATWRIAGALLAAGLVLAGAIILVRWALTSRDSPNKAAPSAATPTPSSIASTADQDNNYIQALNDRGISFADPGNAVKDGKTVCQNIGQGMTVQQVVEAFRASSPAFSGNAEAFVGISVRTYCPQNSNLVAGF